MGASRRTLQELGPKVLRYMEQSVRDCQSGEPKSGGGTRMDEAIQAIRSVDGLKDVPIELHASKEMTEVACFAALFEPGVSAVHLVTPPRSDKEAPDFLAGGKNVKIDQLTLRVMPDQSTGANALM